MAILIIPNGYGSELSQRKVYPKTSQTKQKLEKIWDFLQRYPHAEPPTGSHGISWIELLILLDIHGIGIALSEDLEHHEQEELPKAMLQRLLLSLKVYVRQIISKCAREQDQVWFTASQGNQPRLNNVAVTMSTPCIRWLPVLPLDVRTQCTICILKQRGKITMIQSAELTRQTLRLPEGLMQTRRTPQWRDGSWKNTANIIALPHMPEPPEHHVAGNACQFLIERHLYCPHGCAYGQSTLGRNLFGSQSSRWSAVTCIWCKFTSSSRLLKCRCQRPWHLCERHSQRSLNTADKLAKRARSIVQKRKRTTTPPNQTAVLPQPMLRSLAKKPRAPALVETENTLSHSTAPVRLSLGPVLAARFPYLAR